MPDLPTVHLAKPIRTATVLDALDQGRSVPGVDTSAVTAQQRPALDESRGQQAHLATLCQIVGKAAEELGRLQEETLTHNRSEIAKLAVEIARKITMCQVEQGDYDLQAIVEEALSRAPARQNIVIHVNPEDLPRCQQLQKESADGPFSELEFTADWSVARAECLVETPKGIVKSFVQERLERIGEALQNVE
jgi:flagellar biosynthesis/type III secretory pathway protein FliH